MCWSSWPRTAKRLSQRASWQCDRIVTARAERNHSGSPGSSKPVPLYTIPRLVLDLDAEGCTQVRPYNEQDEQEQLKQWSQDPKVEALIKRVLDFKQEVRASRQLFNSELGPFDVRKISPRDVCSVAFLGTPNTSPDQSSLLSNPEDSTAQTSTPVSETGLGILSQELLQSFGVSNRLLVDSEQTISLLLKRLQRTDSRRVATKDIAEDMRTLKAALAAAGTNINHVSRSLGPLLGTSRGCQLISLSGRAILSACAGNDSLAANSLARETRSLLANLAINLSSRAVHSTTLLDPFGPFVQALLGPQLALDASRILLLEDILVVSHTKKSLGFLRRSDILRGLLDLVFKPGCFSGIGEKSLHEFIRENQQFHSAYAAYILSLGTAGALRCLWHEWQWSKPSLEGQRLEIFVTALTRALSCLQQYPEQAVSKAYASSESSLLKDVLLDLGSMNDLDAIHANQNSLQIPREGLVGLSNKIEEALNTADVSTSLGRLRELSRQLPSGA